MKKTTEPVVVYSGKARGALKLFPQSANVCATFGLCTLGLDKTKATLIADPKETQVVHQLKLSGDAGDYELVFRNHPSTQNPKTSAVVAFAILKALRTWHHLTKNQPQPHTEYIFL